MHNGLGGGCNRLAATVNVGGGRVRGASAAAASMQPAVHAGRQAATPLTPQQHSCVSPAVLCATLSCTAALLSRVHATWVVTSWGSGVQRRLNPKPSPGLQPQDLQHSEHPYSFIRVSGPATKQKMLSSRPLSFGSRHSSHAGRCGGAHCTTAAAQLQHSSRSKIRAVQQASARWALTASDCTHCKCLSSDPWTLSGPAGGASGS